MARDTRAGRATPPRGMRDFLPREKARREHALAVIRSTFSAHGFDEIETPVMEDAARLHAGLGGDNEKLAFGVLRRGLSAEDVAGIAASGDLSRLTDLGLRYDLTVPLARFYATHRAELPTVFKAIQIAPVWRAERPQKGRYRQFMQCDIDIVGEGGPLAEVELIAATAHALRQLGLTGCRIHVNDRRLLTGMLDSFGFAAVEYESALVTFDKLDKIGREGVVAELRSKGFAQDAVDVLEGFLATGPVADEFGEDAIRGALPVGADDATIADLAAIGRAVTAADTTIPVVFDPFLVRGMGYYTGPIFEIVHPELGYSLGGGGRYDAMIGSFLGEDVPACGFSLGFERIVDLLEADAVARADSIALLYDSEVGHGELLTLKSALVADGVRTRLEPRTKNTKAQLDRVAASGYHRFAFVDGSVSGVDDLEIRQLGEATKS